MNQLDEEVNRLGELNEMLCERLGVGEGEEEEAWLAEWRRKRETERQRLQSKKEDLQNQVCEHGVGEILSLCHLRS